MTSIGEDAGSGPSRGSKGGRSGRRDDGGHGGKGGKQRPPQQQLVVWAEDQASFRIEQEGVGLSDHTVRKWLVDLHKELGWVKKTHCSILNLSRNELGDFAVGEIVKFFIKEGIAVKMIKLYKNWISDDGMRALGELLKHSPDPAVQEIHLSHNFISHDGALAVLQAVRESKRYPCSRGRDGSPLWLRMENNNIVWDPVIKKLTDWDFAWACGDTRDSWRQEIDNCPLVSMHRSYHHQNLRGASNGGGGEWPRAQDGWADGDSDRASSHPHSAAGNGKAAGSGAERPPRWAREWEQPRDWARDPRDGLALDEDGGDLLNKREIQAVRRFLNEQLTGAAEAQAKKFNLIFSILNELQDRQAKLEATVQELIQQEQQQQQHKNQVQGYTVQIVPVDGGQQNWAGGDQHHFGGGVW